MTVEQMQELLNRVGYAHSENAVWRTLDWLAQNGYPEMQALADTLAEMFE